MTTPAPLPPRSTLDVEPLPPPRGRRTLWVALGIGLVACGTGMLASLMRRSSASARPTIAQPLSQPTTVPSPSKTELPAPATPAVNNQGTLVVRVDSANARIELDGDMVAQSASGARMRVDAGEHELVVTSPGRHRYTNRVGVASAATVELAVHLRHDSEPIAAAPAPKPAEPKKPHEKRNDPDYLVDPFSSGK